MRCDRGRLHLRASTRAAPWRLALEIHRRLLCSWRNRATWCRWAPEPQMDCRPHPPPSSCRRLQFQPDQAVPGRQKRRTSTLKAFDPTAEPIAPSKSRLNHVEQIKIASGRSFCDLNNRRMIRDSSKIDQLNCARTALPGPNTDYVLQRRHENLAIANHPGSRAFHDGFDHRLDEIFRNRDGYDNL